MLRTRRLSTTFIFLLVAPLAVTFLAGCTATGARQSAASASVAANADDAKIARVWTGYVDRARADEYETYLSTGITKFPTIPGNKGVQMLRRDADDRVTEFTVISYWPSMDAIKAYAGDNVDRPRPLPRDPEFMVPPGASVRHYTIREWLPGNQ